MTDANRDPASFRDPRGHVFEREACTVSPERKPGLDAAVSRVVSPDTRGLVESAPREDPRVREMLALREDVFPGYTGTAFLAPLRARARGARTERASSTSRTLAGISRK